MTIVKPAAMGMVSNALKQFFWTEIYYLSIDISNLKGKNITLGTLEGYNLPLTDKNNKQQLDNFLVETKS